jgi:hypothetical protein
MGSDIWSWEDSVCNPKLENVASIIQIEATPGVPSRTRVWKLPVLLGRILCYGGTVSRLIAKTGTLSVREHGLHSYIQLVATVRSTLNEYGNKVVVWRPIVRILGTDLRWRSDV